jgi:hypothetical protein
LAFAHRVLIAKCDVLGVLALMFIWHAADLFLWVFASVLVSSLLRTFTLCIPSEYFLRQNSIAGGGKLKSRLENKST